MLRAWGHERMCQSLGAPEVNLPRDRIREPFVLGESLLITCTTLHQSQQVLGQHLKYRAPTVRGPGFPALAHQGRPVQQINYDTAGKGHVSVI